MSGNPWDLLTGNVIPPEWSGEARVHHLADERKYVPAPKREKKRKRQPKEKPQPLVQPDDPTLKKCKECKCIFPRTLDHFYAASGARDGLRGQCKDCFAQLPSVKDAAERQRLRRQRKEQR